MSARLAFAAATLCAASLLGAAAHAEDDVKAGEVVFNKCRACHTTEANKNKVGPSLFGVVGRKAGTVPGFNYSEAMKTSGIVWTDQELDRYLTDPKSAVPGNKMAFPGLKEAKDREHLVAYLKTQM